MHINVRQHLPVPRGPRHPAPYHPPPVITRGGAGHQRRQAERTRGQGEASKVKKEEKSE